MGYKLLAYAIIKQAVRDYRERKEEGRSVSHISKFFNSDWCDFLLQNMHINGKDILKHLKSE